MPENPVEFDCLSAITQLLKREQKAVEEFRSGSEKAFNYLYGKVDSIPWEPRTCFDNGRPVTIGHRMDPKDIRHLIILVLCPLNPKMVGPQEVIKIMTESYQYASSISKSPPGSPDRDWEARKYAWQAIRKAGWALRMKISETGATIRIPVQARREDDVVYFGEYAVGIIGPLCPDGFMKLTAPVAIVCIDKDRDT